MIEAKSGAGSWTIWTSYEVAFRKLFASALQQAELDSAEANVLRRAAFDDWQRHAELISYDISPGRLTRFKLLMDLVASAICHLGQMAHAAGHCICSRPGTSWAWGACCSMIAKDWMAMSSAISEQATRKAEHQQWCHGPPPPLCLCYSHCHISSAPMMVYRLVQDLAAFGGQTME